MINWNFNYIESNLNRPGPILSTQVFYLLVGGGGGGNITAGVPNVSGEGGEVVTGVLDVTHLDTLEYTIGWGGRGFVTAVGGGVTATSSSLSYPSKAISVSAAGGRGGFSSACSTIYPCNAGDGSGWVDPSYTAYWGMDGGITDGGFDGWGGGKVTPPTGQPITWPWDDEGQGTVRNSNAYNHTGGGGGVGSGRGGFGAQGMAAFSIYDPRDVFEIVLTTPSRKGGDQLDNAYPVRDSDNAFVFRNSNGYKIWYVTYTDGVGTFQVLGKRD